MEPDQGPAHYLDNSVVIGAADSSDEASAESDSSDIDRAVFYAVLVTTMLNIMHPPMNLGMVGFQRRTKPLLCFSASALRWCAV